VHAGKSPWNGPRFKLGKDISQDDVIHRRSLPLLTAQYTCRLLLRGHTTLFGCVSWDIDSPGLLDHACGHS
jgi:hypothetical protein